MTRRSKYGAKRVELDGHKFASKLEAKRYMELKLLERARKITELRIHPPLPIIVNDQPICTYIADFSYCDVDTGKAVFEDTKGVSTPVFNIKRRLVEAIYGGIDLRIIKA